MTDDTTRGGATSTQTGGTTGSARGLGLAAVSAASFGLSGPIASALLDTGWTPGAIVLLRITLAALVVGPLGLWALGGRWHLLVRSAPAVLVYGLLAVAAAQFCYFAAVQHMQVGPALLIEYTAPAAIVGWLWLRHGQRPTGTTLLGALVAAAGLVLVLDLVGGGAGVDLVGALWALGAMVGAAAYFLISGADDNGLPPVTLAAGGLVVGAVSLGVLGATGLMPLAANTHDAALAGTQVPWWLLVLVLGVVTAGVAYVTGVAATRALGSRLASFVALSEVLSAVLWAWALLGQLPSGVQLAGGLLVLLGVVGVKLGEGRAARDTAVELPVG